MSTSNPKLYLPIGPPASGKSHLVESLVNDGWLTRDMIVSPDALRVQMAGSLAAQHSNDRVFEVVDLISDTRYRNGLDVWIDATNLWEEYRDIVIRNARSWDATVHVIRMTTEPGTCLFRNDRRESPVPRNVMTRMLSTFHNTRWDLIDYDEITSDVDVLNAIDTSRKVSA